MKPECEEALLDIQRFLDGELGTSETDLIDAHLHECTPCMERADFKRHVKDLIASRCGCDEVPQGLKDRLAATLSADPRSIAPEA